MRVLVANPNSTGAITQACVDLARQTASPGTAITGWTNDAGPPVVDSVYADYLAGSALVRGLVGLRPVPDAVVLAGFGNYGTAAVKEALSVSVVSMAEAAMAVGGLLCHRFVIVTTSPRMVPYTEDLVRLAGFDHRCAGRACRGPPASRRTGAAWRRRGRGAGRPSRPRRGGTPGRSRHPRWSAVVSIRRRAPTSGAHAGDRASRVCGAGRRGARPSRPSPEQDGEVRPAAGALGVESWRAAGSERVERPRRVERGIPGAVHPGADRRGPSRAGWPGAPRAAQSRPGRPPR